MRDIASELAELLEGAGLGLVRPPAPDANLFTAPMSEKDDAVPDRAVALIVTGGDDPVSYLGRRGLSYLVLDCQVRIRSACEDFQGDQMLAYSIFDLLGFVLVERRGLARTKESAPLCLGADRSGRGLWLNNFKLGQFSEGGCF